MSRGVLLFAFDRPDTRKYTKLAAYCAIQVKRHLKLPVAIVTNNPDIEEGDGIFDVVTTVQVDGEQTRKNHATGQKEHWVNFGRYGSYHLSPFDETIVMDTDYIVGSTALLKLFDMGSPLMCHRTRLYIGPNRDDRIETFGSGNPMSWATIIYFNRSEESEAVFEIMKMVQHNYGHYASLYNFDQSPFRNDYAISIAINTVFGHLRNRSCEIPWALVNSDFETAVEKMTTGYRFTFEKNVDGEDRKFIITTKNQDVHILNKHSLLRMIGDV